MVHYAPPSGLDPEKVTVAILGLIGVVIVLVVGMLYLTFR